MDTPGYGRWQWAGDVLGAICARQAATADVIARDLNMAPALANAICRHLREQGLLAVEERLVGNRLHTSYRVADTAAASDMVRTFEVVLPADGLDGIVQRTIAWLHEQSTETSDSGHQLRVKVVFSVLPAGKGE